MTNREAIEILKTERDHMIPTLFPERIEAMNMAISALQEQDSKTRICHTCKHNPPSKKWPCVDCDMREPADRWEPKDVPDTNVGDMISRQAALDAVIKETYMDGAYGYSDAKSLVDAICDLPSVQPEWNNHTVACLLAELFDDTCACNYNGIDEWLPSKCELLDSCPNPVGVACWEQYLKHRAERRTDE